jgi:hypothetical protein
VLSGGIYISPGIAGKVVVFLTVNYMDPCIVFIPGLSEDSFLTTDNIFIGKEYRKCDIQIT